MVFNSNKVSFDLLYANLSYTYLLPQKKSNFCNITYLSHLYAGKAYAPKRNALTEKFCARPPLKEFLVREINKRLVHVDKTIGDTSRHLPDQAFLLVCLSTLHPQHEIFHRAYIPPPREPRVDRPAPVTFDDPKGLFADMGPQPGKKPKSTSRTFLKFATLVKSAMSQPDHGQLPARSRMQLNNPVPGADPACPVRPLASALGEETVIPE